MAKRTPKTPLNLPPELEAALDTLDLAQKKELLAHLMALSHERFLQTLRPVGQNLRVPRRDPFGLVVRIDLVGAKPPIWRRVELPSTLMLDEVHVLLQLLFGWTDSHLHRFALGPSVWDRTAELFLCPFDADSGEEEDGTPAAEVRIDEVLHAPADVLRYVYDYGDEWQVTLKVEKVTTDPFARPRVIAGRRQGPPDDCGGIWAWNENPDDEPLDLADLDAELALEWPARG